MATKTETHTPEYDDLTPESFEIALETARFIESGFQRRAAECGDIERASWGVRRAADDRERANPEGMIRPSVLQRVEQMLGEAHQEKFLRDVIANGGDSRGVDNKHVDFATKMRVHTGSDDPREFEENIRVAQGILDGSISQEELNAIWQGGDISKAVARALAK